MQSLLSKLVKNHPHRRHHHLHLSATLRQPQQLVHVFLCLQEIDDRHHLLTLIFTANSIVFYEQISLDNFKSERFHTLITNAFSHMDIDHIFTNMCGLCFFGPLIGRRFGPEYLLKLYLARAVVGSIFYLLHQSYKSQTSKGQKVYHFLLGSVNHSRDMALRVLDIQVNFNLAMMIKGASAAVYAIVLLYVFLFPRATIYKDFSLRVPAYQMEDSNISGSAHLGGAVVAAIAWARIKKRIFEFH
ncbi:hypothetical protein PIB30_021392 [Stylosanthes scabra]|uniref:Peptidase S54 rhomboid domain-containing protein n=1 Tax=Stylosanthes scabra TaxID=79078 RepID=A0ABU6S910_9FABA|nr:hypothetical protein [Stylosanthes scabra]